MHCTDRFRAGLTIVVLGVAACTGCGANDASPSATCVNPGGLSHQTSLQRIAIVDRPTAVLGSLSAPFVASDWNSVILRTAYSAPVDGSADDAPRVRLAQTRPIALPDGVFTASATNEITGAPVAPPPVVVSSIVRLPPISGSIPASTAAPCPQSVLAKPHSIDACPPGLDFVGPQAKLARPVTPPAVAAPQPKLAAVSAAVIPNVLRPAVAVAAPKPTAVAEAVAPIAPQPAVAPPKPAPVAAPVAPFVPQPAVAIAPPKPAPVAAPVAPIAPRPAVAAAPPKPAPVTETAAPIVPRSVVISAQPQPAPVAVAVAPVAPLKPAFIPASAHPEPTPITPPMQRDVASERARSAQLDALMRQAAAINRHAFEMAQRGAIYSARAELMRSLHLLAAGLDGEEGGSRHQQMLAAGLQALDEAGDFVVQDPLATDQLDVARLAAGHRTTLLKVESADGLSPQVALGRYLTYSQQQLAEAVGNFPPGSAALYALGKIYSLPTAAHGPTDVTGGAKSVVYYQASLQVDSRNFLAANELGVLLVQYGRLPEARAAFCHSLNIVAQPVIWENLAVVLERLGEQGLAVSARQQAALVAQRTGGVLPSPYNVQWVDQSTFASSMPLNVDPAKGSAAQSAEPKRTADASAGWSIIKR